MRRTCGEGSFRGWITAATVQNIFLQIIGAIVNILSLWCLWKCRRTGRAIKLQMGLVFVILLLLCTVILPGEGWINYMSFYCHDKYNGDAATIFFLLSSGFIFQLERMNISSVAIYRFAAVQFPQVYKKLTQVKVVLALEAIMCVYIAVPYVMGFTQTVKVVRFDDGNQYIKFGEKNTTIYGVIYKMYGYNFLIPSLITLTAYSLLVSTILYQKYKSKVLKKMDHVTFTLQFLILVDLLLDGPHVISHVAKFQRVASQICHMIFHLHLVADPVIFLFINPHNRRMLLKLLQEFLPQSVAAYLPPVMTSTNTHPKDSLHGMSSPTPTQRRKHLLSRRDINNSQLSITSNNCQLQRALTTSADGSDKQQVGENTKPVSPLALDKDYQKNFTLHSEDVIPKELSSLDASDNQSLSSLSSDSENAE